MIYRSSLNIHEEFVQHFRQFKFNLLYNKYFQIFVLAFLIFEMKLDYIHCTCDFYTKFPFTTF